MSQKKEFLLYVPGRTGTEIYWSRHTSKENAEKRAKKDGMLISRIEEYLH
jgi:hypothetical protein